MQTATDLVLEIKELKTWFHLDEGTLKAVNGVNLSVARRRTLGLIGESGCGKSVTAQSVLRIVPHPGRIMEGEILFHRQEAETVDLARLDPFGRQIRDIRGREISMIFQEPMTSLSPVHTIGFQIRESLLLHRTSDAREAKALAVQMLEKVGVPDAEQRYSSYPHQLSGGLRQRAMIAMALSCSPLLLIADEPTTALDVTVQAQILDLMRHLQEQMGMAMLYITHDLGVIAEIADEVAVMYLGYEVEYTQSRELFHNPLHPYTQLLLKSIPRLGKKGRSRLNAIGGTVPIPLNLPAQCPFLNRCPQAMPGVCDVKVPPLMEPQGGHYVRCFLYGGRD